MTEEIQTKLLESFQSRGLEMAIALLAVILLKGFFYRMVKKLVSRGGAGRRRAATLAGVLNAIGDVVLYFIVILVVLRFLV